MKNYSKKTQDELTQRAIDLLKDGVGVNVYGVDLHHELFNSDYYIIGRYQAEQWLNENGGVFNAIEIIKDYEEDNFGEVSTDFSEPESIVNMLVYIIGQDILNECQALNDNLGLTAFGEKLTAEDIKQIVEELQATI